MRDGAAGEADAEHALAGVLGGLFDGHGDFLGLAVAQADVAGLIAGGDECFEGEVLAALDDLRGAEDTDGGRLEAAIVRIKFTFSHFSLWVKVWSTGYRLFQSGTKPVV